MSTTQHPLYHKLSLNDLYNAISDSPLEVSSSLHIPSRDFRDKGLLLQKLLQHGPYWTQALNAIVEMNAARSSRTPGRFQSQPNEQMAPDNDAIPMDIDSGAGTFLDLPSDEEYMSCYRKFFNATSNSALRQLVCGVCARLLNANEAGFQVIPLESLPNRLRLRPSHSHRAQILTGKDRLLLERKGCIKERNKWRINVCHDCHRDLLKPAPIPPKFSLANNLWIGTIPFELRRLTLPERLLIARVFPRVFVVKLFPKGNMRHALGEDQLSHALRGNVTTFELNSDAISNMIDGNLMPQPIGILASLLSITFIGRGKTPNSKALECFVVRRARVAEALFWLKANNKKYYGNIDIDFTRYHALPEHDVPDEIRANIRHEEDTTFINRESDGYVPSDETLEYDEISGMSENSDHPTRADVVPLQYLGVMDNELSEVPSSELKEWALQNMYRQQVSNEGTYAIRHGAPVNTFGYAPWSQPALPPNRDNYWEQAFPYLYPYGMGGIESDRPARLSLIDQVRWSLRYHDRRFRSNETFIFVAFGIHQRRLALAAARIQIRKSDFETSARVLDTITPEDLEQAAREESLKQQPSNPAVRLLKRYIKATTRRIIGSNQARIQLRSQIWSTSLYLNPPTVWITINPDDLHDPIAQVFAGENIDLDNFINTAGPDKERRSKNMARDPFAAAQFFNYTIKNIIENLFGITTSSTRVTSEMGVLGQVKAYFRTVECQGRGTLHLHMLLWLDGAPPPRSLKELLHTSGFREKVVSYLRANVRTYLPSLATPWQLDALPTNSEVAYSRPPNPFVPYTHFQQSLQKLELDVVRTKQMHKCVEDKCLRVNRFGNEICKRRAPWELSNTDTVEADGTYRTRRTLGYLNGYCPAIATTVRSNQDIKILTYGRETDHIAFYVTKYIAKPETRSHNTSSLLAKGLMYYYSNLKNSDLKDIQERQQELLDRSISVLNQEHEMPAPLVVTHLMGWGDVYRSHQYAVVFWASFVSLIRRSYPDLQGERTEDPMPSHHRGGTHLSSTTANNAGPAGASTNESNANAREEVMLDFNQRGRIYNRSQIDDYIHRGDEADGYCVLDYFVGTHERSIPKKKASALPIDDLILDQRSHVELDNTAHLGVDHQMSGPGRPAHTRINYRADHPRHGTHVRIVRPSNHNVLPNLIGPHFPQRSDPTQVETHAAWALTLLKPWRDLDDLKLQDQTWADALNSFIASSDQRIVNILDNLEHYNTCEIAAENRMDRSGVVEVADIEEEELMDLDDLEIGIQPQALSSLSVTPEMVANAEKESENMRDLVHSSQAVDIARNIGVFSSFGGPVECTTNRATERDLLRLKSWQEDLKKGLIHPSHLGSTPNNPNDVAAGNVILLNSLDHTYRSNFGEVIPNLVLEPSVDPLRVEDLRFDQRRAYNIVHHHLLSTLNAQYGYNGPKPTQLLMVLSGAGGTGKSRVIQTITDDFARNRAAHTLLKAAYTGIAASLIDGQTTHHLASIAVQNRKRVLSAEAKKKLAQVWRNILYLIIDEFSMLSKEFLAQLSRHITAAKAEHDASARGKPFGGVNVILCGDFHQFPPVATSLGNALYSTDPSRNKSNTPEASLGRGTYEKFRTVVILTEQMRVVDPEWRKFLDALREGRVREHQIGMLKELVLTNPRCVPTNFESDLWKNSHLITPRHSVRIRWNDVAVAQHCEKAQKQLYICPANDTCADGRKRRPLHLHEQLVAARSRDSQKNTQKSRKEKGGLPDKVPLAVGLKIMVTLNVATGLDVANGARGTIVDIVLDPDEPAFDQTARVVTLSRLPAYILVKLDRTRAAALNDLQQGVLPIVPASKNYTIAVPVAQPNKQIQISRRIVRRLQFPITPAYAFTDYRSQGQTIPAAIVDIATPPSGSGLNLANVYVALSRSQGRETIRLLRDFDEDIFLKPLDSDLVKEDDRLKGLDRETREKWSWVEQN